MKGRPIFLALAGPSCSGKSTVAHRLRDTLGPDRATVISLDNYYKDLSQVDAESRAQHDFDHPEAWEHTRIVEEMSQLRAGQPIQMPQYDFVQQCRLPTTTEVLPAEYLILEGIFATSYPRLNALTQLRVFLNIPLEVALDRRIQRDVAERGRDHASIKAQFEQTVAPSYKKYQAEMKQHANLTLSGMQPPQETADAIIRYLKQTKIQ